MYNVLQKVWNYLFGYFFFNLFVFCCLYETGPHVAWAGLKFAVQPRMTLNFSPSSFHLLSTGIEGMKCSSWFYVGSNPRFPAGLASILPTELYPQTIFCFFLHHIKTLKVSGILLIVTFIICFRKLHSLLILFTHLKFKSDSIFHGFSDVFDN